MAALNTLLLLLAALAIPGLINRTRALLAGRKGIRFAQHLYDVRLLLLRKGAVYSPTTTAVLYWQSFALLYHRWDKMPLHRWDGTLCAVAFSK